jgi:hypothetical protein
VHGVYNNLASSLVPVLRRRDRRYVGYDRVPQSQGCTSVCRRRSRGARDFELYSDEPRMSGANNHMIHHMISYRRVCAGVCGGDNKLVLRWCALVSVFAHAFRQPFVSPSRAQVRHVAKLVCELGWQKQAPSAI